MSWQLPESWQKFFFLFLFYCDTLLVDSAPREELMEPEYRKKSVMGIGAADATGSIHE